MNYSNLPDLFFANDFAIAAFGYLSAIALKGALILFLTIFLRIFLNKASAAVRHFVSCVFFTGLLFLPLVSFVLPAWQIPLLSPQIFAYRSIDKKNESFEAYRNGVQDQSQSVSSDDSGLAPDLQIENKGAGYQMSGLLFNWRLWLLLVYLTGATLIAARWLAGIGNARRAAKQSSLIVDPNWTVLESDLTKQLEIGRKVKIYKSFDVSLPMTFGFRHPVVLLPITCHAWTEDRRRRILLHEFAHIKRGDYVFHGLIQLACALHWFNPLVWLAARKMRLDAEHACDDVVLESDTKASDYAADLLEFARRGLSTNLFPAAVPILRQKQLEKRLRLILEPDAARRTLTSVGKSLIFVMLVAIIAPLAAAQFTRPVSGEETTAVAPRISGLDEQNRQSEDSQTDSENYASPQKRAEIFPATDSVKRNRNFKAPEKNELQKTGALQIQNVSAKTPENSSAVKPDGYNYQKTITTGYNFNYVKTTVQKEVQNTVQKPVQKTVQSEVQNTVQRPIQQFIQKSVQDARMSPEPLRAKGDVPK